nr:TPA_exp: hypothetical protein [Elizabethkingia anophelis]
MAGSMTATKCAWATKNVEIKKPQLLGCGSFVIASEKDSFILL